MNPIVIIAGIGILYLLTRQTPGGPPAVPTTDYRLPATVPGIAIGEFNPTAGGGGGQYGSGVGDPRTYGGGGGGASNANAAMHETGDFMDWLYGLPVNTPGNDPRYRPGVVSANDL